MENNLSILNEDGSCDVDYKSILSDEDLKKILQTTVFNREFDNRMLTLQRQGRLGFYLGSFGEEVLITGCAKVLNKKDPVFLSYRELGVLFWRGVPLEDILNQYIGNSQDLCKGKQMPVHYAFKEYGIPSVSSPVGTQLPHACGYAYASKLKNTGEVSLAFLGEGTSSGSDFPVSLNFASVLKTPVIYVIRNNGYAISTPQAKQYRGSDLSLRGEAYGVPSVQIDGNDILMVVKTMQEAADRARSGEGPTLIEGLTYRSGSHSSSDDPSAYRTDEEEKQWNRLDGLRRMARHGEWRGIWSAEEEAEEKRKATETISKLIKDCEKWPPPAVETLFDDVYETLPVHLQEQKENYLKFLHGSK